MAGKTRLVPLAMKDGTLVDVDSVERGLQCGCVCQGCNIAFP